MRRANPCQRFRHRRRPCSPLRQGAWFSIIRRRRRPTLAHDFPAAATYGAAKGGVDRVAALTRVVGKVVGKVVGMVVGMVVERAVAMVVGRVVAMEVGKAVATMAD